MPSRGNKHNANGHRRRQLVARIKASSTHCALCGLPLYPDAKYPDPASTVVDEDIPRARGGDPLDPHNTNALHALCNGWKSTMTLREARAALARGATVHQRMTQAQRRALLAPTTGTWEKGASRWT